MREWIKGDKHRYYVEASDIYKALDLEVGRYKTGSIKHATMAGERISNSKAWRILADLDASYYDAVSDRFIAPYGSEHVEAMLTYCREALR